MAKIKPSALGLLKVIRFSTVGFSAGARNKTVRSKHIYEHDIFIPSGAVRKDSDGRLREAIYQL